MDRSKYALEIFEQGFSCSQAVLTAFAESFGLDLNTALKISQSFGGGMAHMGETCGAVTGAFMVIGLKYGRTKAEDTEAKEKTYDTVLDFVNRFKSLHSSIVCKDILGYDLSKDADLMRAQEQKIFETICPKLIRTATEICEQILNQEGDIEF